MRMELVAANQRAEAAARGDRANAKRTSRAVRTFGNDIYNSQPNATLRLFRAANLWSFLDATLLGEIFIKLECGAECLISPDTFRLG